MMAKLLRMGSDMHLAYLHVMFDTFDCSINSCLSKLFKLVSRYFVFDNELHPMSKTLVSISIHL